MSLLSLDLHDKEQRADALMAQMQQAETQIEQTIEELEIASQMSLLQIQEDFVSFRKLLDQRQEELEKQTRQLY